VASEANQDRLTLCRQQTYMAAAVSTLGIGLGVWAGRGDWAALSDAAREQAGVRALHELDAVLVDLAAFRDRLASVVLASGHRGPQ